MYPRWLINDERNFGAEVPSSQRCTEHHKSLTKKPVESNHNESNDIDNVVTKNSAEARTWSSYSTSDMKNVTTAINTVK
jgi:hypothetical protein